LTPAIDCPNGWDINIHHSDGSFRSSVVDLHSSAFHSVVTWSERSCCHIRFVLVLESFADQESYASMMAASWISSSIYCPTLVTNQLPSRESRRSCCGTQVGLLDESHVDFFVLKEFEQLHFPGPESCDIKLQDSEGGGRAVWHPSLCRRVHWNTSWGCKVHWSGSR